MSGRFTPTRLVSAATAGYGVFALARPQHLPDALGITGTERASYLGLAKTYGVRDVLVSLTGVLGSRKAGRVSLGLRIASDLTDCALLLQKLDDPAAQRKTAAATIGWALLNTAVLVADLKDD
ncbi:hypothetical protein INN71_13380 [Nocardioides sp. ChNu-153]|uniref:hypothetical protein n=1 Tax=unclassified Nocardioides TaxID=2615069 RepID=UPI0024068709|nr:MULTISPECIES: hypothetical protein [unclassified Nocardioides]MDF9715112.1 hypothetical protein [Nocardioides sp. ChNu-99]MDN7122380.1 hypothetical protein [Nocardioides sp. ChNu-153]